MRLKPFHVIWLLFMVTACASRPLEPIEKVGEEPTAIHTSPSTVRSHSKTVPASTNSTPKVSVIPRYILEAIQAQGPGRFLQRVPVLPFRDGGEFVGFQILDLFPGEGIRIQSIRKGDVVTKVNGRRVDRPEQFMKLFEELHLWTQVSIQFERKGVPMSVLYEIQ